jgi:hypothetical protein
MKNLLLSLLFIVVALSPKSFLTAQNEFFRNTAVDASGFPAICVQGEINPDPYFCFSDPQEVLKRINFFHKGQPVEVTKFNRETNISKLTIHFLIDESIGKTGRISNVYNENLRDTIHDYFASRFVPLETKFYIYNSDSLMQFEIEALKNFKTAAYTHSIQQSFLSQSNTEEGNLDLVLIIQNSFDENEFLYRLLDMHRFSDGQNAYIASLSRRVRDRVIEPFRDVYLTNDKIWFVDKLDNLGIVIWKTIENHFFWLIHSNLEFCMEIPLSCEYRTVYSVDYSGSFYGNATFSGSFDVTISTSKAEELYAGCILHQADSLALAKKYTASLDFLRNAQRVRSLTVFESRIYELIFAYGDHVLAETLNPFQFFDYAEKTLQLTPVNNRNYKELKTDILKRYYQFRRVAAPVDSLIFLNDMLVALEPSNNVLIKESHLLLAIKNSLLNNYAGAAAEYLNVYNFDKERNIADSVTRYASLALKSFYEAGNFLQGYATGNRYFSFISSSFANRYRYAASSFEARHYIAALNNFEWLLNNWTDNQNLVKWEKVHEMVVTLYALNNQFDNALDHFQRYYRSNDDDDKFLRNYLAVLRAKYLFPFINVIQQVSSPSAVQALNGVQALKPPEFITGVFVYNAARKTISAEYNPGKSKIPDLGFVVSYANFPMFTFKDQNYWMVNKKGDDYYAVLFSHQLNIIENNYYAEVRRKPDMVEPWADLYVHQRTLINRFVAAITTALLQIEYGAGNLMAPDQFGKQLQQLDNIHYVVFHNEKGEIATSYKFVKSACNFTDMNWEKSSTTMALFSQDITSGSRSITDIASPLFVGGSRKGVFRIGFIVE